MRPLEPMGEFLTPKKNGRALRRSYLVPSPLRALRVLRGRFLFTDALRLGEHYILRRVQAPHHRHRRRLRQRQVRPRA